MNQDAYVCKALFVASETHPLGFYGTPEGGLCDVPRGLFGGHKGIGLGDCACHTHTSRDGVLRLHAVRFQSCRDECYDRLIDLVEFAAGVHRASIGPVEVFQVFQYPEVLWICRVDLWRVVVFGIGGVPLPGALDARCERAA